VHLYISFPLPAIHSADTNTEDTMRIWVSFPVD
jgi:hypothetical protein